MRRAKDFSLSLVRAMVFRTPVAPEYSVRISMSGLGTSVKSMLSGTFSP